MNSNQTTVNPSTAQTELNISLGGITVINPHIPLPSNNLIEKTPPNILYHGTNHKHITAIIARGIEPKLREYAHLTAAPIEAYKAGHTHGGRIVICTINAKKMHEDGYKFYVDDKNVWNIKHVPNKYFKTTFVSSIGDLTTLPKEV